MIVMTNVKAPWPVEQTTVQGMVLAQLMTAVMKRTPVQMTVSVMDHSFVELTANAEHNVLVPMIVAALAYLATVVRGREIAIAMMNVKALWSVEQTTVLGMVSAQLMTAVMNTVQMTLSVMVHLFVERTANAEPNVLVPIHAAALAYLVTVV